MRHESALTIDLDGHRPNGHRPNGHRPDARSSQARPSVTTCAGYVHGGKCSAPAPLDPEGEPAGPYYMGYSVRSHSWRMTWCLPSKLQYTDPSSPALVSNWSATGTSDPPALVELYDHHGDDGTDFDWPGNNRNVASEPANADVIAATSSSTSCRRPTQSRAAHLRRRRLLHRALAAGCT